jgi:HlyD family secretion protein
MAWKARTIFMGALGLAVVGALGFVALREEPVPVDLHTLAEAPMQVSVNAEGKTRIREVFDVAAPITGTLQRAPLRVGDPVVAGQTVVAVVEPAASGLLDARSRIQAEAAVREAEAALHLARSGLRQVGEELTLAETEYNRAKALTERGVASASRLEVAELQLAIRRAAQSAAISELEMRMSALERARASLLEPATGAGQAAGSCCVQILAPADGRVLSLEITSEQPVQAGQHLLSVGQPDDLEIVADLLSVDAVRLQPGAPSEVTRWGGPGVLEARLAKIEPNAHTKVSALGLEEQRVDVIFDLLTPPEDRPALGNGFSVFLRIVEWESEAALQVPISALFRVGDRWASFVVEDGRAAQRLVAIGQRNAHMAEVIEGLSPGDQVILHPSDDIASGTAVLARAEAAR